MTAKKPNYGSLGGYEQARADRVALDQIVKAYSHIVEVVAYRFLVDLPASVDRDDLISEGKIGLIEAINRFDPGKNVKFETFATWRIRGAILDYLRKLDWSPRSLRKRAKEIAEVTNRLDKKLSRPSEEGEIAAELGISVDEYRDTLGKISCLTVAGFSDLEPRITDRIEDKRLTPEDETIADHISENLANAIRKLPEKEKLVLELYYHRELSLKEIGNILDLSESRICQIHSSATLRLREMLTDWREAE
ncbi:FliA/WhiG family RNA polymerase sigma factor [bacterium]|nr:FliA/WhiG family RNA polymerase sigma factor [bacterium]